MIAVPRNGDELVRSNREAPSDNVRNIVKQILATSDFFLYQTECTEGLDRGKRIGLGVCGYCALMTWYRTAEVLEVRILLGRGVQTQSLFSALGQANGCLDAHVNPLYLNREVSIQLGFQCQAFSTRDLFVSMPSIHNS